MEYYGLLPSFHIEISSQIAQELRWSSYALFFYPILNYFYILYTVILYFSPNYNT